MKEWVNERREEEGEKRKKRRAKCEERGVKNEEREEQRASSEVERGNDFDLFFFMIGDEAIERTRTQHAPNPPALPALSLSRRHMFAPRFSFLAQLAKALPSSMPGAIPSVLCSTAALFVKYNTMTTNRMSRTASCPKVSLSLSLLYSTSLPKNLVDAQTQGKFISISRDELLKSLSTLPNLEPDHHLRENVYPFLPHISLCAI